MQVYIYDLEAGSAIDGAGPYVISYLYAGQSLGLAALTFQQDMLTRDCLTRFQSILRWKAMCSMFGDD